MLQTHREVFRLYVEEGIRDVQTLMERTGFSETHIRRILRQTRAVVEYRRRIDKARKLFHELDVTDADLLSALTGLRSEVIDEELHLPIARGGLRGTRERIPLRTAGEILRHAAEQMLADAVRNGLSEDNVKSWMTLANAFETFRTGEYRLEMIVAGIEDFAAYIKEHAKEDDMNAAHIMLLMDILNRYRKEKVEQLRAHIELTPQL